MKRCCFQKTATMFQRNQQQWKGFVYVLLLMIQYCTFCVGDVHFHENDHGVMNMCSETKSQQDTCAVAAKPREKRIVGAILFAVSIFATIANLALDIYLQVKGCCGLYPSACVYDKKFNAVRKDLKTRVDRMNDEYTECENTLTYIKTTNRHNDDIFQELNRIMSLKYRIINTLDSKLLYKLGNFSTDLKNSLMGHNETVKKWGKVQFNTAYNGVFSSATNAAMGLAPVVGMYGIQAIMAGVRWYKKAKVAKQLAQSAKSLANAPKAAKILGVKDVKSFVKASTKAQTKALKGVGKMAKFAKVAGAVMSVVTIGFEIYSAVKKIKACEKVRDKSKEAYEKVKGEPIKMEATEKNLTLFEEKLNSTYEEVSDQLRNETFLIYIHNATKLARGANKQTAKLKAAAGNIEDFYENIKTIKNRNTVINLQQKLTSGLRGVEYAWTCFDTKISVVDFVYKGCKRGSNSFEMLFKQANDTYSPFAAECTSSTGHTYLTRGETRQYVENKMKIENLLKDCKLNSKDIRSSVCLNYALDKTDKENAKETELKVSQVQFLIPGCKPAKVSPNIRNTICGENAKQNLDQTKKKYHKYNQAEVETTFKACPPPSLNTEITRSLCIMKSSSKTVEEVKKKFNQYRGSVIENAYNNCPVKVSQADIDMICFSKMFMGQSLDKAQKSFSKYPASAVATEYNKCA